MLIHQQINDDLKTALKAGDQFTVDVLRFVNAVLHNKSIEKRGKGQSEELTDEEVIELLAREVKKRQEAAGLYQQGGRLELAEKETKEIVVIHKYLPAQLSREEIEAEVAKVLLKTQTKDFGLVMKAVMTDLRGKADAKVVSEIVKQRLAS